MAFLRRNVPPWEDHYHAWALQAHVRHGAARQVFPTRPWTGTTRIPSYGTRRSTLYTSTYASSSAVTSTLDGYDTLQFPLDETTML